MFYLIAVLAMIVLGGTIVVVEWIFTVFFESAFAKVSIAFVYGGLVFYILYKLIG